MAKKKDTPVESADLKEVAANITADVGDVTSPMVLEEIVPEMSPEKATPVDEALPYIGNVLADLIGDAASDVDETVIKITAAFAPYVDTGIVTEPSVRYIDRAVHDGMYPFARYKDNGEGYMHGIIMSWVEDGVCKSTEVTWG